MITPRCRTVQFIGSNTTVNHRALSLFVDWIPMLQSGSRVAPEWPAKAPAKPIVLSLAVSVALMGLNIQTSALNRAATVAFMRPTTLSVSHLWLSIWFFFTDFCYLINHFEIFYFIWNCSSSLYLPLFLSGRMSAKFATGKRNLQKICRFFYNLARC